jgi:hypothetical protein
VDYFVHNVLRLRGEVVRGYYFQALKGFDQGLFRETLKLYGRRSYPPEGYTQELHTRLEGFQRKWGLENKWRKVFRGRQLGLFEGEDGWEEAPTHP